MQRTEKGVRRLQLTELLTDCNVLDLHGDAHLEVRSLAHDSRAVEPGDCFACIPGAASDGHDHAPAAVKAGAVALLVERHLGLGVAEAQVASVRAALGPAAARLHGAPSTAMACLGVTGTNGKTTVTYLVEAIARAAGARSGVIGTTGARIDGAVMPLGHTTPEATELQALLARMRDAEVEFVAMEVSSHALVQHRVDGTRFAASCFTNLSHDHLDFHGDLSAYFEAKATLFESSRTACAVTNVDDPYGAEIARRARDEQLPVITFGIATPEARLGIENIASIENGLDQGRARTSFQLVDRETDETATVRTSLIGRANLANSLAAAASSRALGLPWSAIIAGLEGPSLVPGRLESIDLGQPFAVLVDYAHTPAALTAALEAARDLAHGHRVVLVFGCGGDRDASKRPLMGRAAAIAADEIVLTSDNPRSEDPAHIADQVMAGMADTDRVTVELDRRRAIRVALTVASRGEVVLIAGKGHESTQTIGETTVPFDDRVVVHDELGTLTWS